VTKVLSLMDRAYSQIRQDLVALSYLDFKRDGFFLEFGATNGIDLNNTHLMETEFGWTGILAEPDRHWQNDLKRNRSCIIDTRCVANRSGEQLRFTAAHRNEASGLSDFVPLRHRLQGAQYDVESVSLNDLLEQHNAPEVIDFASVDTEGSEFSILDAFDFSRWKFRFVAIEHNWKPQREKVFELMTRNGYKQVHKDISRFDDWYVHADA